MQMCPRCVPPGVLHLESEVPQQVTSRRIGAGVIHVAHWSGIVGVALRSVLSVCSGAAVLRVRMRSTRR